jgi:hypothetical protein
MKKLILIVILLFIPTMLIVYELKKSTRKQETFSKQIEGKIIKILKQNRGGTKYYCDSNNFFIEANFAINENDIVINDSVFKSKNSKELLVYRRNQATSDYIYHKAFYLNN